MTEQDWNKLSQEIKEYADKKLNELSEEFDENTKSDRILWHETIDTCINKDKEKNDDVLGYEINLHLLQELIDRFYRETYQRYETYFKRYSNFQHNNKIDFNKLVNEINNKVPERFKNKPVKIHYFPMPFLRSQLNFNPYRNGGALLPSHYSFIDKKTGYEIKCSKGETYIIEQLHAINKYEDYYNIAPLFIFTVMNDYKYFLIGKIDEETINNLIVQSRDLLIRNGYEKPDYRYKYFIINNHTHDSNDYLNDNNLCSLQSEEELSLFIVNLIDKLFEPFDMAFYTYDEREQKRAEKCYKDAVYSFHESIISYINE